MQTLTIGQVARQARINVETIRYYERRGLIAQPDRPRSGFRHYTGAVVDRIHFIKQAQKLGFSLEEVAELLSLRVDTETTCADIRQKAEAKIAEVEEKLRELRKMKRALAQLAASCTGRGPAGECPILEALDMGGSKL